MKRKSSPVDVLLEGFTPVFTIDEKLMFAEYYADLSGWIEVFDEDRNQIYCNESGSLKSQLKELKADIAESKKNVKRLEQALAQLEKKAKGYLK
jgi:predicted nuclease with TOPRIM domain